MSTINSQSLLKLMSIELVIPSNHLILCRRLLLPSIFPSIRAFSNESVLCIRWPISPSNEYSGLISFTIDWLDLLAVQGTLKSLLQHHNLRASIFWHSAFFMIQLSCPLSRRCHPTVSCSVTPFSSCSQSFPTSGFFPMSQLFASGGQSIGVSASTSVLPMNTQD